MQKKTIIFIIIAVLLIFLAIAGFLYFKNEGKQEPGEFDNKTVYYLKFVYGKNFTYVPVEEGMSDFVPFSRYVTEFLPVYFTRAYFDAVEAKKNNYDGTESGTGYYILVDSKENVDTSKTYDKNGLHITIEKAGQNLLPYFKDAMYCETEGDCSIRDRECSYGSFNKYNSYHGAWGCEGYTYYPNEGENQYKLCGAKELPVIEYSGGSKCINKKCAPQDKKVSCIPNNLP